jgi:hypothetical protein
VRDYAKQYHWDDSNVEALRSPSFVYPQLQRIEGLASHPIFPMNSTATCQVTVLDEDKQPIPNAKVSFWPNQYFFLSGSNIVGDGTDSLTGIRAELKTGKKVKPDFTANRFSYTVTTDAQGKATISNLPAGLAGDAPREEWFVVSRDDYVAIPNSKAPRFGLLATDPELVANLAPGETEHVTIRMKKRPANSPATSHE